VLIICDHVEISYEYLKNYLPKCQTDVIHSGCEAIATRAATSRCCQSSFASYSNNNSISVLLNVPLSQMFLCVKCTALQHILSIQLNCYKIKYFKYIFH
jgi:hypothetical protein